MKYISLRTDESPGQAMKLFSIFLKYEIHFPVKNKSKKKHLKFS